MASIAIDMDKKRAATVKRYGRRNEVGTQYFFSCVGGMLEFSEPSRGSVIFPSPVDELGPEIDRATQKHRNRFLSYPVY